MGFQKNSFQTCKLIIMTLASYPLVIVLFAVSLIYRKIIDIILRIRHGEKYGGLYGKMDSFFITKYASKPYITGVLILKNEKERAFFNEFKEMIRDKIFGNPDHYPKLTGLLAVFGGYPYIIRNSCDINECVHPMPVPEDVEFDENYLKDLTGSIINTPLPQNDTATWEFLPSTKPFKRDKNDPYYYYPLIVRFNHAVTDGNSLMAFVLRILGDDDTEVYNEKLYEKLLKKPKKMTPLQSVNLHMKKIAEVLKLYTYIFFMGIGKFIHTFFLLPADQNALHGPQLTENKFVAWTAENEVKYVPMVKRIKSQIDSKFAIIISTAITAALTNYFKRNSYPIPESTKCMLTVTLSFPKVDRSKPVPLKNNFTCVILEMPSHNHSAPITNTVRQVTEKYKETNYGDIVFNNMLISQMGILPIQLLQAVPLLRLETTLISNVPGGTQVKLLGGCIVDKLIPFAPNFNKAGITICILTYDDKFQIGILADKVLMKSQKNVQLLVDDIYKYFELLEKESTNTGTTLTHLRR